MPLSLRRAGWERAVLLAVAFEVLKVVSSHFVFPPLSSAILWLPAGLTLAFFLRSPTRMWPALLLAVFLTDLVSVGSQGFPWEVATVWSVGNALRTLLGATLMRRWLGSSMRFHRVRDVLGLLVFGALVAALPSATLGALAAKVWLDSTPSFAHEWEVWWLSDVLGTLLVAPLVLTWWPVEGRSPRPRRSLELWGLLVLVALVGFVIFRTDDGPGSAALTTTLPYAAFPLVLVAALRLGGRGATSASAVMSAMAVEFTRLGHGPFGVLQVPEAERVLSMQVFMAVLGLSALTVSAVVAERRRAEAAQRVLARAGEVLAESPDWSVTLPHVTELLVPEFASGAAIWLTRRDGVLERVAASGWGPSSERGLRGHFPPVPEGTRVWRGSAGSGVLAPMRMRGRVVGALALTMSEEGRVAGLPDEVLAEDLSRRCSMALENAELLDEARAAVAVREDFIAVAAHELRTPLATLTLRIQAMLARSRDVERDGNMDAILRQVRRLTRLVENVLDVGVFKSGELELRRERVDMVSLVRGVVARHLPEAARVGTQLELSTSTRPIIGWLDVGRVDQALSNLLANALKFGAGSEVDVSLSQVGTRARLSVRDRGIGIPPEAMDRIFAPFERAVSVHEYGGLGLGLYLVRRIVEAHGGAIHVEDGDSVGATFVLELPVEPRVSRTEALSPPHAGT
ncbi:MASE1 domain-containing protein [Myxococcus stipitatus]|uniref:sensor histidine kinase n=1 Tax=Myxococcus stipitatus TaxID=83455 RepID=UPI001F18434E|nr:MASE1 domain-containing protein [Myxococcus stipitatus]MCE9670867.1 MASE1 domain-containing protein [Myxococcus stipitatus]